MDCEVIQQNNYMCGRPTYKNEVRCYIHIRKWIQLQLKSLGLDTKFPRKIEEIENGLTLIKETDPNYKDKFDFNIIHRGVMSTDITLINHGIKIGVNINGKTSPNLYTPLFFTRCHVPNIIPLLLKAGIDIDSKDVFGLTYLDMEKNNVKFYKNMAISRNNNDMLMTIRKNFNLLMLPYFWNTQDCIKWRESIIYRFVNRLPNISNRGALFDIFYEYFEFCHILCIQYV